MRSISRIEILSLVAFATLLLGTHQTVYAANSSPSEDLLFKSTTIALESETNTEALDRLLDLYPDLSEEQQALVLSYAQDPCVGSDWASAQLTSTRSEPASVLDMIAASILFTCGEPLLTVDAIVRESKEGAGGLSYESMSYHLHAFSYSILVHYFLSISEGSDDPYFTNNPPSPLSERMPPDWAMGFITDLDPESLREISEFMERLVKAPEIHEKTYLDGGLHPPIIAVYMAQTDDAEFVRKMWELYPEDRGILIHAAMQVRGIPAIDALLLELSDDFRYDEFANMTRSTKHFLYRPWLESKAGEEVMEPLVRKELEGDTLGAASKNRIARAAFARPDEVPLPEYARRLKLASDVMVAEPDLAPLILEEIGVAPPGKAPSEPGE